MSVVYLQPRSLQNAVKVLVARITTTSVPRMLTKTGQKTSTAPSSGKAAGGMVSAPGSTRTALAGSQGLQPWAGPAWFITHGEMFKA